LQAMQGGLLNGFLHGSSQHAHVLVPCNKTLIIKNLQI